MAFDWAATFAPPTSISGFTSGSVGNIDEWPFSAADTALLQNGGGGSGTIVMNFDLSGAPGDPKGIRLWLGAYVANANGYAITAIRIKDGTTTLENITSPGLANVTTTGGGNARIIVVDFADASFSGAALDDLNVEIDLTNLHGSNNQFIVTGARLSKSPFTAAQEATPPSTLAGAEFACYRAADLAVLGAADGETVVVVPDASGHGRHLVRRTGTTVTFEDDTIPYLNAPIGDTNRFIWHWGSHEDTDIAIHAHIYPYTLTSGGTRSPAALAGADIDFYEAAGAPGEKHILAIDQETTDKWVMMSGDGTGPAHLHGGTPTTDTWWRITEWIQQAGNEHMWENDDATPVIDAASGSNELYCGSAFGREDDNTARAWEGRIAEIWIFALDGETEGDLDTARDEWVAGLGGGGETATLYPTGDGTTADVVDEADTTTDLYASADDDPASPNDADWINNTTYPASVFLELTDLPGDFAAADAAEIVVRYRGQTFAGSPRTLYARLYQADETTPLSDEAEVATVSTDGSFTNTAPIAFTGVEAADKTAWDGAKLRLRWST